MRIKREAWLRGCTETKRRTEATIKEGKGGPPACIVVTDNTRHGRLVINTKKKERKKKEKGGKKYLYRLSAVYDRLVTYSNIVNRVGCVNHSWPDSWSIFEPHSRGDDERPGSDGISEITPLN